MNRPLYSIPKAGREPLFNKNTGEPGGYEPRLEFVRPGSSAYSFGRGARSKMDKIDGPAPGTYESQGKAGRRAPAFGFAGKYKEPVKENVPGPGNYSIPAGLNSSGPQFSMPKDSRGKDRPNGGPGPGAYVPVVTLALPQAAQFSFPKNPRGAEKVGTDPGPGAYASETDKRKVIGGAFGKDERREKIGEAPGPGAYEAGPSSVVLRTNPGVSMKSGKIGGITSGGSIAVPGPGVYDPSLDFARARPASVKFGSARRSEVPRSDAPGPGAYAAATMGRTAANFSFGKAPAHPDVLRPCSPGPGAYEPVPAKPDSAKYTFSKAGPGGSTQASVGPGAYDPRDDFLAARGRPAGVVFGSEERNGSTKAGGSPGPGNYDPATTGQRNAASWVFGRARRDDLGFRPQSPGPGTYAINSVFSAQNGKIRGPAMRARPRSAAPSAAPGPGAYDGRVDFSRPNTAIISFGKATRFRPDSNSDAGPGQYDPASSGRSAPAIGFGSDSRFRRPPSALAPGPGAYDAKRSAKEIAYSMRPKTAVDKPEPVPGPGAYDPNESQHLSLGRFDQAPRSQQKPGHPLGPGAYELEGLKPRSQWTFPKQKRSDNLDNLVPGPGMYEKVGFPRDHPAYVLSGVIFKN